MKKQVLMVAALLSAVVAIPKLDAVCFQNLTGNTLTLKTYINKEAFKGSKTLKDFFIFGQEVIAPIAASAGGPAGAQALKVGKAINLNDILLDAMFSFWQPKVTPNTTACYNWLNYFTNLNLIVYGVYTKKVLGAKDAALLRKIMKFEKKYNVKL